MADEVLVKHGEDGKITVCIGEKCVTVSCAEAEEPEEEGPGGPLIDIQLRTDVFDDLDAIDWEDHATSGVQVARSKGTRLVRRRDA